MVGGVLEEANPTKSRWREWLLSSSLRGKVVAVRWKRWGPEHRWFSGNVVGAGRFVDRGFGGNGRMVTVAVEKGRVGIGGRAPAGR